MAHTPSARAVNRRGFIASSAALGALTVLPSGFLRGADKPSDKLDLAFVGMGGKMQGHVSLAASLGHNIVAFCDVDQRQIDASLARHATNATAATQIYRDYRELFDRSSGFDAVVVSTPDHWHAPICKAAIAAGKHVYCEKPLTHTVAEARELRGLSRRSRVVTQTGNQGAASANQRRAIELVRAGLIGEVRRVHVWHPSHGWASGIDRPPGADAVPAGFDWDFWLGVAPQRPYKDAIYHPAKWRGWYDFGNGSLGDFCCHGFSLPVRALHLDHPSRIEVEGEGLGHESFATAATVRFHFEPSPERNYPVELIFYTGGHLPPAEATAVHRRTFGELQRTGAILSGSDGEINAGLWNSECHVCLAGEERYLGAGNHPAAKKIPQSLPRAAGQVEEWLAAIRGGNPCFSDFDHGGKLTEIGLAGVVALRLQRNLQWDGANLKAIGVPEADAIIAKPMRDGYL